MVDTNVFLHVIGSDIYGVAVLCKESGRDMVITQTIMDELEPGYYRETEDSSTKEIAVAVRNYVTGERGFKIICLLRLADIAGAEEELKKIRKRYYGWMNDAAYLHKLVEEGIITREEIRSKGFRKKDLGECELIAIAKASKGEYMVVTNDRGRVYKHPDLNLFDIYAGDSDVKIISGEEWIAILGYREE